MENILVHVSEKLCTANKALDMVPSRSQTQFSRISHSMLSLSLSFSFSLSTFLFLPFSLLYLSFLPFSVSVYLLVLLSYSLPMSVRVQRKVTIIFIPIFSRVRRNVARGNKCKMRSLRGGGCTVGRTISCRALS